MAGTTVAAQAYAAVEYTAKFDALPIVAVRSDTNAWDAVQARTDALEAIKARTAQAYA
jgi:hypothetical protein